MLNTIEVNTGEVNIGEGKSILICRALGSCIAVLLIDTLKNIGGIAHVMLPGKAPAKSNQPTRYAENAISSLIKMTSSKSSSGNYIACIVGGGNVLKRIDDKICQANSSSVLEILNKYKIPVVQKSIGGYERRSVKYHVQNKLVKYTIGESDEKILFQKNVVQAINE